MVEYIGYLRRIDMETIEIVKAINHLGVVLSIDTIAIIIMLAVIALGIGMHKEG